MSNTQKTLLTFFDKAKCNNVDMKCPGCGKTFLSSKLKWHKDFECKSTFIPKKSSRKSSRLKKKVIKKNLDKPELICIDDETSEIANDKNVSGIRSSPASLPLLINLDKEADTDEPQEKNAANIDDEENNGDLTDNKENLIDILKSDWDSFDSLTFKEEVEVHEVKPEFTSPSTLKGEVQTSNLDTETASDKLEKTSDITTDFSLIQSSQSEDEFRSTDLIFNSPSSCSQKTRKRKIRSKKKSKNNTQTVSEGASKTSLNHGSDHLYSDSNDSINTGHPSMLVTPVRTPSPSPSKVIAFSPHILRSPSHFNLKKTLSNSELSNENVHYEIPSPSASGKKSVPGSMVKFSSKVIPNSSFSPHSKTRRKLNISFDENLMNTSQNTLQTQENYRTSQGLYLQNFLHIIDVVISQPEDLELFNSEDFAIMNTFHKLSLQAQKLYVRLFQRKLKWNRVAKLDYKEICDKEDIYLYVNELVYAEYLLSEKHLTCLYDFLLLLDVSEMKNLCKDLKIQTTGNKEVILNRLIKCHKQQNSMKSFCKKLDEDSQIMKQVKQIVGQSVILNKEVWNLFMRILLLYSPPHPGDDEVMGQQIQLTALLMSSIGRVKFPKYTVKRHHALFHSREDVLSYQEALHLVTEMQDCFKNQAWQDAVKLCKKAEEIFTQIHNDKKVLQFNLSLPPFLRRFTTLSLLWHIQFMVVESYQRLRQYGKAVTQLEKLLNQTSHLQDCRGKWYDRLALNLHQHLKRPKKCLEVIMMALEDPEVRVGYRLSLSQRAKRLMALKSVQQRIQEIEDKLCFTTFQEAPKVIVEGRSLTSEGQEKLKRIFLTSDGDGDAVMCSVEELALNYYRKEGYPNGLHGEGRTVRSLFGLFLWKVIYLPVPDAFRSAFQTAPLDLDSPHFYQARKELIDRRLKKMENWSLEKANQVINKVWSANEGCSSLVDWNLLSRPQYVQGLVASLGLKVIAAICRRLAMDHRFTRSGFPDLIVWNPEQKTSRIVEVKGPNDTLSTKQILWLDYLLQHDAVAEVCYVAAVGAKRTTGLRSRRISPKKSPASEVAATLSTRKRKRVV